MNKKKTVVVSGYFDPIHSDHIRLFREARRYGERLIVIVNNDTQAKIKKGRSFMPIEDRETILSSLRCVDEVFISIDKDHTVRKSLAQIQPDVFVNGGDRGNHEIPEAAVCKRFGIIMVDGIGPKENKRSSSQFIKDHMHFLLTKREATQ